MSRILRVCSIVAACALAVSATYAQVAPDDKKTAADDKKPAPVEKKAAPLEKKAAGGDKKAAPLEKTQVPKAVLSVLRKDFAMAEVVSLLSASETRASSKAHLETRASLFQFLESKNQGPLVVDAYTVLDNKSNVIGYRLFYRGDNGPLLRADAVVNSREKEAAGAAEKLVAAALDSVSPADGSKVYFLGIQNLDASRVVRVMVQAGAQSSSATDYAIQYVVSGR